jgi:hypothetical protein
MSAALRKARKSNAGVQGCNSKFIFWIPAADVKPTRPGLAFISLPSKADNLNL